MHERHQSHTTLPDPIVITTIDNARLTVSNQSHCTVSIVNKTTGSDGITHRDVSEGRFIIKRHGINYVDHQPASVWLELVPVVHPGDPEVWHGGWLEGHHDPATTAALTLASRGEKLTEAQRELITKLIS